jgi:protein-S-isoprenylcysteine O-methyltransferase Ste14
MDPAFLVAAIAITSYCIIGSRLEERKLLVYHGEVYRRYRERVPALLPLPWKKLSKEAAQELLSRHLPK